MVTGDVQGGASHDIYITTVSGVSEALLLIYYRWTHQHHHVRCSLSFGGPLVAFVL